MTASKKVKFGLCQILSKRWKLGLVLFAGISGLAYLCNMITTDQEYLGRAVIEVKRNLQAGPLTEKPAAPATLSPGFMRTQVMVLSCEENMLRVVHKLDLAGRWNISLTEASAKLSRMLQTIHEPDTDLITIEVLSTNTHEAAELANAVAEVYSERRVDEERERIKSVLMVMESKAIALEANQNELLKRMLGQEANPGQTSQEKENPDSAWKQAESQKTKQIYKISEDHLNEMRRQLSNAELNASMPMIAGVFHERAYPNSTAVRPYPLILLPSALGYGLVLSIIVTFLIEKYSRFSTSRATPEVAPGEAAAW